MPTQNNIDKDSELYRGVLEYDYTPTERVANPNYGKGPGYQPLYNSVPCGPVEVRETMIGPYQSISPIKAYISRRRGQNNLRLKRVERVSAWEKVDI